MSDGKIRFHRCRRDNLLFDLVCRAAYWMYIYIYIHVLGTEPQNTMVDTDTNTDTADAETQPMLNR